MVNNLPTPGFLAARLHCVPGEDPAVFDVLIRDYQRQFAPQGPCELFCLETMTLCDWKRRRLVRAETQLLSALPQQDDTKLSRALHDVVRQLQVTDGAYFRALRELRKLQQERRKPAPAEAAAVAESLPAKPAASQAAPQPSQKTTGIGLVSQKPEATPVSPTAGPVPHYDLGAGNPRPGLVFVG